jgi:hypothetical protein
MTIGPREEHTMKRPVLTVAALVAALGVAPAASGALYPHKLSSALKPAVVKPALVKPSLVRPALVKPGLVRPALVRPALVRQIVARQIVLGTSNTIR